MVALHRLYVIEIFRIDTMSKWSDIQRLSLWLIRPGDQVLCIASHQEKTLPTVTNYDLLLFLLEHNLNKEI